ncbi:heavy-metal-associated domain-containing protein [Caproiciproducens faecalis]|uniref:Heavy-metal-associated domain-containing protein n=1 Tax=Caproiciproducens faecalis TaxID=2820301 RepID=A0ABS7DLS3_9FIRM|nr:heavy metal-associated domain-containing protein [Caproiciproducens faecalis]MBW7572246.1 heavy-metal-associated domain-containing protein [Caproiciproducens faecalis]
MSKASAYFQVENMTDKKDVETIKKELDTLHGVISVSTNTHTGRVAVDYDTTGVEQSRIEDKLQRLGYKIQAEKNENHVM